MNVSTHAQTGGAASTTDIEPGHGLKNYTVHKIQVTGLGTDTATISGRGPSGTFTDIQTLANDDIFILDGYWEILRVTWGPSSGGSLSIRSYNLDAIDGGR